MYINYMVYVEDMFCFSVQMAIKLISEAVVAVCRIQVGSKEEEKLLWNAHLTSDQELIMGSISARSSNIFTWRLIMKYFLVIFSLLLSQER